MSSVALTDFNNLFALVKFYQAAIKKWYQTNHWCRSTNCRIVCKRSQFSCVFLCKNNQGYQALTKLVTKSYIEGQRGSGPTLEREWLTDVGDDLIVLSGARDGDVGTSYCCW